MLARRGVRAEEVPLVQSMSAVATWVGALTRGGILRTAEEERGVEEALALIGEERLSELREHFAEAGAEVGLRERRGAILACIWMAHADRELAPEEASLLEAIILQSDFPSAEVARLTESVREPPELEAVAASLTYPPLRELMLALAWQLAMADGRVDAEERGAYGALAEALGVDEARAGEIRERVGLELA